MFEYDTNHVYYCDLIHNLEDQCICFEDKLDSLKKSEFDENRDNDVRLSFYYLSIQLIEAAIHLMILNNHASKDSDTITSLYAEYGLRDRSLNSDKQVLPFEKIRVNNSQFITNQYFISIFSLFEHCLRIILKECAENLNPRDLSSIKKMVEYILKEYSDQNEYIKNFDSSIFYAMNDMRNAVHNNGLYFPQKKNSENENKIFHDSEAGVVFFRYKHVIHGTDPWKMNIFMIYELFRLFNAIIEVQVIKSNTYIEDPSAEPGI